MTLIGNKLGSYEDSQDEKSKAEKALDKAKKIRYGLEKQRSAASSVKRGMLHC